MLMALFATSRRTEMEQNNDFKHRPNSKVEFRTPEEMDKYQKELIMRGLNKMGARKKLVISPSDPFPFIMEGGEATKYLQKLQQYMVNTATLVLLEGFLETLDKARDLVILLDTEQAEWKVMYEKYEKFLLDVAQNVAILHKELDLK